MYNVLINHSINNVCMMNLICLKVLRVLTNTRTCTYKLRPVLCNHQKTSATYRKVFNDC